MDDIVELKKHQKPIEKPRDASNARPQSCQGRALKDPSSSVASAPFDVSELAKTVTRLKKERRLVNMSRQRRSAVQSQIYGTAG